MKIHFLVFSLKNLSQPEQVFTGVGFSLKRRAPAFLKQTFHFKTGGVDFSREYLKTAKKNSELMGSKNLKQQTWRSFALLFGEMICIAVHTLAIPCKCPLQEKLLYGVQNDRRTADKIWCVSVNVTFALN